jgi:Cu/Ag efflux protein CusF
METTMSLTRVIPALIAASLLASTAALAASQSASGEIKSIDAKQATITLKTGETFQLPKSFDVKSLKAGENVSVTYDNKNGKMMASAVKPL